MLLLRNLKHMIDTLIKYYGTAKTADTVIGDEFMKLPLITSETHIEWKHSGITFQKNEMIPRHS